jgi:hypothetical protein
MSLSNQPQGTGYLVLSVLRGAVDRIPAGAMFERGVRPVAAAMRKGVLRSPYLLVVTMLILSAAPSPCFAQGDDQAALPRFGVEGKGSTLGFGVEAATAVTSRSNVRIGVNLFGFGVNKTKDGISFDARLKMRSLQATFDYYLWRGFHVSPGALLYNGNAVTASVSVPGGRSFRLSGTTYYSDANNPITGNADVSMWKTAPMILIGYGNLLPRNGRHFTANVDVGLVYEGAPAVALNLAGGTCDAQGLNCQTVSGNPAIQSSIQSEQAKLSHDLRLLRFYPVLSFGFGWRF